jgi:hypothetical protein
MRELMTFHRLGVIVIGLLAELSSVEIILLHTFTIEKVTHLSEVLVQSVPPILKEIVHEY